MNETWLSLEKTIDEKKFRLEISEAFGFNKISIDHILLILESCRKPLNISVLTADNKYFEPQDIESVTNNGELIQINLKRDGSLNPFLENIKAQLDADGCRYLLVTENEFESGVCYTNTHDKDFKGKVNDFIKRWWK